jgi:hypothetical protein
MVNWRFAYDEIMPIGYIRFWIKWRNCDTEILPLDK